MFINYLRSFIYSSVVAQSLEERTAKYEEMWWLITQFEIVPRFGDVVFPRFGDVVISRFGDVVIPRFGDVVIPWFDGVW